MRSRPPNTEHDFKVTALNGKNWDVAVVGAGVLGTFHAYFSWLRGLRTLLIERNHLPIAASVRNFGMIIPSGMAPGDWLRRGLRSVEIYKDLSEKLKFPINQQGTQYIAGTPLELKLIKEFSEIGPNLGYQVDFLDDKQSCELNPVLVPEECYGSLYFPGDLRLDPRYFLPEFIHWLSMQNGFCFLPKTVAVHAEVEDNHCRIRSAKGDTFISRTGFICSGADQKTLFPNHFSRNDLKLTKLQMLRTGSQNGTLLRSSLATGLSLRRYWSFRICPSWEELNQSRMDPKLKERGIHILMVQDSDGKIVLGDSHEYSEKDFNDNLDGQTEEIIIQEASRRFNLSSWKIVERWHGVYSFQTSEDYFHKVINGRIHLITGIGGKGMTTSPGLAKENIESIF